MKILVIGGHGFLGKTLCKYLRQNHEVYSPTSKQLNLFIVNEIHAYLRQKFDIVINLAASVGGISYNKNNQYTIMYENLQMGLNLLNAAKDYDVKLIQMGTICSYPKICPVPFKEEYLWSGYPEETNAPYGIAKLALMEMVNTINKTHGHKWVCPMLVNLAGSGDRFDERSHVIPDVVAKVMRGKRTNNPPVLLGDGSSTREFIHPLDASRAIELLFTYEGGPINIGSGKDITIKELVNKICSQCDYTGEVIWGGQLNGQPKRLLDISQISKLGFVPQISLDQIIEETVNEYKLYNTNV